MKIEMKRLNIEILGMSKIKREDEGELLGGQLQSYLHRRQTHQYRRWNNIKQGLVAKGKF